jgi:DNA repair protein RadD
MSKLFYPPFYYQTEAVDAIFEFLKNKMGDPLVVSPGGSGKTVMIAEFCRRTLERWTNRKILVLSDDQEILRQDYDTIKAQLPDVDIGLYSAGLKSRTIGQITVAGIQSVFDKPELLEEFNIAVVDECDKISYNKNSRYQKLFKALKIRKIGFTATPFRLGTGYIHIGEDAPFTEIIYTIKMKTLQELDPPRLCKMFSKKTFKTFNASAIKKQSGDFILKELSLAFDKEAITREIVSDLRRFKLLRKKWLVYAIDIEHCKNVSDILNEAGIRSRPVHSKTGVDRKEVIKNFRETDDYQALVSVAMLTTGVDIPPVDMIVLLRSTSSARLHVQIIVRGARVSPETGKLDCLVMDYAGNLKRNGPIDNPVVKLTGKGTGGEAIMKVCEQCDEIVHAAVRICPCCGAPFIFEHHLNSTAAEDSVMTVKSWHKVDSTWYEWYVGAKNIAMMMVYHRCGPRTFSQPFCIEHGGNTTYRAQHWWKRRSNYPVPKTATEAVDASQALKQPTEIFVDESGKYDQITDHKF